MGRQAKKPLGLYSQGRSYWLKVGAEKNPCTRKSKNLGGSDIDNCWLITLRQLRDWWQLPDYPPGRAVENSAIFAEQASGLLQRETFESYELQLDRYALETILKEHQFFWALDESMTQLLQQARRQGLEVSDINAVLLVGGTKTSRADLGATVF